MSAEADKWEKYDEIMRSETLKERSVKEASKLAIGLAKPSSLKGRLCAISNKRLLGKRIDPQGRISPLWPKKSPGSAKSYASWKR
jgi:hypothetical protein